MRKLFKEISGFLFGSEINGDRIKTEAKAARLYFESFIKEGFSEEQAIRLISAKLGSNSYEAQKIRSNIQ